MLNDTDQLFLSGNNLGSLNEAPDYLENITLLDLRSSNITLIDEKLMEIIIKGVKYLDIRGNNLKTLPKTITKANNMTKLWISDNPYECGCDMLWMQDWLNWATNVVDKGKVTCSTGKLTDEYFINSIPLLDISTVTPTDMRPVN